MGDDYMKKSIWKSYVFWILIIEAFGLLSWLLSMEGMREYAQTAVKPSFSPPSVLFPIVWTVLYALMGIGIARIRELGNSPERNQAISLFMAQLILNFLWPHIFFNTEDYGLALLLLLILWILVFSMLLTFQKLDNLAGKLQIPYLLWLSFAALLNEQVWLMNN